MDYLKCRRCLETRGVSQFYWRNDTLKYRGICKQCTSDWHKKYRRLNWPAVKAGKMRWQRNNPEARRAICGRYYAKNKDKLRDYTREYKRTHQTESGKIAHNFTRRVWRVLKGRTQKTSAETLKLLGCSIKDFKVHIESLFKGGMTWDNYGKWHIDHIKPLSRFDLRIKSHQKECFHYTNTQPLWAIDNRIKSDRCN